MNSITKLAAVVFTGFGYTKPARSSHVGPKGLSNSGKLRNAQQEPDREKTLGVDRRRLSDATVTTFLSVFEGSNSDAGIAIQKTSDEGFVLTGWTYNNGAGTSDLLLVKGDSSDDISWAKAFGGSNYDAGRSIQETADGGFVIAGWTYSYGAGNQDVLVIKVDSSGTMIWAQTIGRSENEWAHSIQETADGGFVITGSVADISETYDVLLIKLDSNGDIAWFKYIAKLGQDYGESVQETRDGGFVITGYINNYAGSIQSLLVVKTDSSGSISWAKAIGGAMDESGNFIQETKDGGFVITGYTESYGAGSSDLLVTRLDSNGMVIWAKAIGGSRDDIGRAIQETTDGGFVITGWTYSYGSGGADILIAKLDDSGMISWAKSIGRSGDDYGQSIQQTSDGGFLITGYSSSYGSEIYHGLIAKLTANGNILACSSDLGIMDIIPTVTNIVPTVTNISVTMYSATPTITDVTGTIDIESITPSELMICTLASQTTQAINSSSEEGLSNIATTQLVTQTIQLINASSEEELPNNTTPIIAISVTLGSLAILIPLIIFLTTRFQNKSTRQHNNIPMITFLNTDY